MCFGLFASTRTSIAKTRPLAMRRQMLEWMRSTHDELLPSFEWHIAEVHSTSPPPSHRETRVMTSRQEQGANAKAPPVSLPTGAPERTPMLRDSLATRLPMPKRSPEAVALLRTASAPTTDRC